MSKLAAGIFILFFCIQLFRIWESHDENQKQHAHCSKGCNHDHGHSCSRSKRFISYSILVFQLLTGFAFAPAVLDSSIAAKKGTILPQAHRNDKQNERGESDSETDDLVVEEEQGALPNNNFFSKEEYDQEMRKLENPEMIQMNERMYSSYFEAINQNPSDFEGSRVKVNGFVYKEDGLGMDQIVLSRFLITHCIADATIIGFLTEFEQASAFQQDTWLEIEGTLEITTYNGVALPLIKAEKWSVIKEPVQPYIYPILIKVSE